MRVAASVFCIACFADVSCAQSPPIDLNSTVKIERTVASEIRRGNAEAFRCAIKSEIIGPIGLLGCMDDVYYANISAATLSDFYLFGLYSATYHNMRTMYKLNNIDDKIIINRTNLIKREYQKIASKYNITPHDYCVAIDADDIEKCSADKN